MFKNTLKLYALLFIVTIITAGGSVLYLYSVAKNSNMQTAREYPAPSTSVAHDNFVLAKNLVDNGIFSLSENPPLEPDAWRTPGYPVFIAPFYAIFHSFYPVLIVQIFITFLTSILIFKMARTIIRPTWALALTVLYLVNPDTMLSASALLTENLFVFVFVAALYLFFFFKTDNFYSKFFLTGFLLAIATYIRPASLYILFFFIPAYFLLYVRRTEISKKHFIAAIIMIVAYTSTLAPWCIRNEKVNGSFDFASTGAYVLFRQNATQFYASMNGLSDIDARTILQDRAGIPRGPLPLDFKYSEIMKKVAKEVILAHPFRYAIFQATTFIPFFTSSGFNDYWRFVHDMLPTFNPAIREPSLIQAINPVSFPLLIVVLKNHGWSLLENIFWFIIAILNIIGLWRSKDTRLARMFFAIVIYFCLVTGPIAHARYRIPVEPLLLISAFSTALFISENRQNKNVKKN